MLYPLLLSAAIATALPSASPLVEPSAPPTLSVLSYNIHGLPWPMALHRPSALKAIGRTLAAMRRAGDEPNVVLLQEAFTRRAKHIAALGDYPYAAAGPTRHDRITSADDGARHGFTGHDRATKGEHDGTIEGSGLLVLSDYPIVEVQRMPYPRYACAGFDCLANKGMLLVRVMVPGSTEPVTIVDTHMNSRGASGVADARSDLAYHWQAQRLRQFVAANVPADAPAIVAGDFNIGVASDRLADVTGAGGVLAGGIDAVRTAVGGAVANPDAAATLAIAQHNKDWMFGRSGTRTQLRLEGVTVPFGPNAAGHMLSDHMGYIATYRVGSATGGS